MARFLTPQGRAQSDTNASVSYSCRDRSPELSGVKQYIFIPLRFWRLEIHSEPYQTEMVMSAGLAPSEALGRVGLASVSFERRPVSLTPLSLAPSSKLGDSASVLGETLSSGSRLGEGPSLAHRSGSWRWPGQ